MSDAVPNDDSILENVKKVFDQKGFVFNLNSQI